MHMVASLNGPLPQPASSFAVLAFLLQSCQLAFSMSFRGLHPSGSCCLDLQLLLDLNSPLRKQRIYIFFFQRSPLDFSILDQALPPTIPTPNVVGWILSPQKICSSLVTWNIPPKKGVPSMIIRLVQWGLNFSILFKMALSYFSHYRTYVLIKWN